MIYHFKNMAHMNLKIEKEKEYNPFVKRSIKRQIAGGVKCFLRAVKPNPINERGIDTREDGTYDNTLVYFYEVGASDGSYRKCTTREEAEMRFAQLVEFEKRQTKIE